MDKPQIAKGWLSEPEAREFSRATEQTASPSVTPEGANLAK